MASGGMGRLSALRAAQAVKNVDPRFFMAARCCVYMGLGMLMASARFARSGAPMGIAMVACSGAGLTGAFALAGAAAGYVLSLGLAMGIRYVAAAVLVYTIAFVFQELSAYRQDYFMPAAAGFVTALTGFLSSFSVDAGNTPVYAGIFLETALSFGAAYFFKEALTNTLRTTEAEELRHSVSVMIMSACALMSFARIVLFRLVSVGRLIALIILMASAMKGGLLAGAAVGTVLGLAMDLTRAAAPFYTMAYAFSGLLSGIFGRHGRVMFVLSFLMSAALAVVCAWDDAVYLSALTEAACAGAIFMLMPTSLLSHVGLLLQYVERGGGESGLRRFVAGRVRNLGEAYAALFDLVNKNMQQPDSDENVARVFDRAADEVCIRCAYKNRCWNTEYMDTLSAMNDATQAMSMHGTLTPNDLPGYFRERCERLPAFVAAVNGELRGISYRRELKSHLYESRAVAWAQYGDVAKVLEGVAEELGSLNGSDPLAERRIVRYLKSLDVDGEAAVYRDGSGRVHVMLEGARLGLLTRQEAWLERLSAVVGVRLCVAGEDAPPISRLTLLEAEPYAVSVGIAALKKRGERVSGDKGTYFKTDSGVLCVILSDGMGTGDAAARGSAEVVAILEKFLRAGVDAAVAMKILNSVMLLRGEDTWGYATADLMCVDLFTGDACFYKYGAAPSYVRSASGVRRIKGETLAAGLAGGVGVAPDIVRMRLKPGCTALIASDGVLVDADDEWVRALMNKGFDDMKALARAALKQAEKRYGVNDDMTVVTVRVEERP